MVSIGYFGGVAWQRTIYGRSYPATPSPRRKFTSECTQYHVLREALLALEGYIPRYERGLFTTVVECRAYIEQRLLAMGDRLPEQKELEFHGDGDGPGD